MRGTYRWSKTGLAHRLDLRGTLLLPPSAESEKLSKIDARDLPAAAVGGSKTGLAHHSDLRVLLQVTFTLV